MQVATLFRETATLLGASMEAGGALQDGALPLGLSMGVPASSGSVESHMHQGYKVTQSAIKPEPLDDGYETSADVLLPHTLPLKCKQEPSDPYSFVDEDLHYDVHNPHDHLGHEHPATQTPHMNPLAGLPVMPGPKKRGRKKKIKNEGGEMIDGIMHAPVATVVKERKKHDRFNGMPEEEVSKRTLPDHLTQNLDIIIIGINPGLFAAFKGHHYAGPGNHFWKCLYLSGLTPEQMTADEDYKLLHVGIGFTNMVQRATKGSADLTRKEIKEGSQILLEKLQHFKPKIAVFNGKLIFEVFSGKKDFSFGRQPDLVDGTNTYMWVMPSSSARCAQLPRAADKVPFYSALKKFRDFLNGMVASLDDSEVVFSDNKLKTCYENEHKSDSNLLYPEYNSDLIDISNAVMKKEDDVPGKKKRGRPKKIKVEGELHKPPTPRKSSVPTNGDDVPKKKRGRPKKVKPDDNSMRLEHTNPNILKCFSSPSPLHSPVYCHMNNQGTPPTPGTPVGYPGLTNLGISHQPYAQSPQQPYAQSPQQPYAHSPQQTYVQSPQQTYAQSPQQSYVQSPQQSYAQSPQQNYAQSPQQPYAQSPQPQSQPFTHSDLSSEISAAISSEHLGSPTSPSLGPPDFDPPSSMPTEDTTECRFSSPAPSSASEHPPVQPLNHHAYSTYRGFTAEESYSQSSVTGSNSTPEYRVQDVSSKSLSGLESLVDQIPSIADGENGAHNSAANTVENTDQYGGNSGPGINAYHGYSTSPGPAPSVPHYPAASYGVSSNGGGYGGLAVSSLNYNPSYPTSGPGIYMDHHPMAVPHALYHPYSQQYGGYGPMSPAPPPALHVPSPNYPYYNSGYGHMPHHTQSGSIPSPIASAPAYLPNHMFDRIKPDIGYGGF